MNQHPRMCLIGEVIIDLTLKSTSQEYELRLGGIFHAARALWAMGISYDLLFIAPDYITEQVDSYASKYGAISTTQIGIVKGAPNVILINEPTEAGEQGYELILRDDYQCIIDSNKLSTILANEDITDIVIFPGDFNLQIVLDCCRISTCKVHIDIANGVTNIDQLSALGRKYETIILSTSSELFLDTYSKSVLLVCNELLGQLCTNFLFKENRGGARFFQESDPLNPILVEAQVRPIVHSVGVGDCFNVIFVALSHKFPYKIALTYASWIAAEYASTTYINDFKRECERALNIPDNEILRIPGVSITWESRPGVNIYIAAPDFDFVDTTPIRQLEASLRYHNFTPRLPIQENGQMEINAKKDRKLEIFAADMKMFSECQIVVAVLVDNDPGTLIEIGLAAGLKVPVIVYDPYNRAENLMLTELPQLVSTNLDEVISMVFTTAARITR